MKKRILLVLFLTVSLVFVSCDGDNGVNPDHQEYLIAKPLKMSKADFRATVDIIDPQPIGESGKIYAYKNFIFINDKYEGVHVIDNSRPSNPRKVAFIKIPGNVDISVKDDYLYADSVSDLVVLYIGDLNGVEQVARLENVLGDNVVWPVDAQAFDWEDIDYENEILVGWDVVAVRMSEDEYNEKYGVRDDLFFETANATDAGTGQGGSLARFKIVDEYLYAVDSHSINVFDISELGDPKAMEDVHAGFDIETIFNKGDHLFLGSMRGMYIYDISSPATPTFVSEFQHGTACDPVVVDDQYAYVTLRGGNGCGATESGLFIVDISVIESPELKVIYPMEEPYGLGIKDDKLFVCDGKAGLKVYDKSSVPDLPQLNHFLDINTFDVIPLESTLLMVGDGTLYQYRYADDGIEHLSTFMLN